MVAGAEGGGGQRRAPWCGRVAGEGPPRGGAGGGSSPAASEREQSSVRTAADQVLVQLAEENRRYEARFGHVFLIAAAGRGADEILAAMRNRMDNDPVTPAQTAAAEPRQIPRLPQGPWFHSSPPPPPS